MTTDEAIAIVNEYTHLDAAVTHKGDQVKCYVHEEGGRHKTYFGADECHDLANAFRQLADSLRHGKDK